MAQPHIEAPTGPSGLSAFFDNRKDAETARNRLMDAGLSREAVRIDSRGTQSGAPERTQEEHHGILGRLRDLFLPAEDQRLYAEGLRRGGYLVTASGLTDDQHDKACDILNDSGAIDIEERAASWLAEGWKAPGHPAEGDMAEHLGASDHVGEPRMYAENSIDALDEDPLPQTPPGGNGKRNPARDRGRVRSYRVE